MTQEQKITECGKCQMLSRTNGFEDKCDEHSAFAGTQLPEINVPKNEFPELTKAYGGGEPS